MPIHACGGVVQPVYITSLGRFLPGVPIGNDAMEDYLGRIGGKNSINKRRVLQQNRIETRHYALDTNGTAQHSSASMAAHAVRHAIAGSELSLRDLTFLASSCTLGDQLVPGLASAVHAELGVPGLELANLQSVCASALMACKTAMLNVASGEHRAAAVTGSEFASRYFRPMHYEHTEEFHTRGRIGFDADFLRFTLSDGAGAAILEPQPNQHGLSLRMHWIHLRSFADRFDPCMTAGYARDETDTAHYWSQLPMAQAAASGMFVLRQDFALMRRMLPVWVGHYMALIDEGRIVPSAIDHVVSHYSSHGLREEVIALLKAAGGMIDEEKWFSNLASKGNTGAASIFILLEELFRSGRVKPGETILCHVPESGRAMNGFMLLEAV